MSKEYIISPENVSSTGDVLYCGLPPSARGVVGLMRKCAGEPVHINQLIDVRLGGYGHGITIDHERLERALKGLDGGWSRDKMEANFKTLDIAGLLPEQDRDSERPIIWLVMHRANKLLKKQGWEILNVTGAESYLLTRTLPEDVDVVKFEDHRPVPEWLLNWQMDSEIRGPLIKAFEKARELKVNSKTSLRHLTREVDDESFLLLYELARAEVEGGLLQIDDFDMKLTAGEFEEEKATRLFTIRNKLAIFLSKNDLDLRIRESSKFGVIKITTKSEAHPFADLSFEDLWCNEVC